MVDNASTDDTGAVLARAVDCNGRLRTIYVDRVGLGAARDVGWRETTGAIVAFTDDDCYLAPDYVDRLLEVFDERPDLACVGGRILLHDPTDHPVTIDERTTAVDVARLAFVRPGALAGANMALRRWALETIGGFDPTLGAGTPFPCEDIDVVAAVAWAGLRSAYDPRPVVRHHHGRKAADLPTLLESYDRCRGAYFTKYLLRSDSRSAYFRGWAAERFRDAHRGSLVTLRRELVSGGRYLLRRRAYAALPLALAGAICFYAALLLKVLSNRIPRRMGMGPAASL